MPPYLAFSLQKLAGLAPCLRDTSATTNPASCSLIIPIICVSMKRCKSTVGPIRRFCLAFGPNQKIRMSAALTGVNICAINSRLKALPLPSASKNRPKVAVE